MTQQTENQSEIGPTDSPRNEAGLLERPKSPDLMDRLQNVLSRIQRAQDDQVETLLECDCGDLIRDLLALLAEKDKVIEEARECARCEYPKSTNGFAPWKDCGECVGCQCNSALAAREQAEGGG